jgi:hypothetical protein
VGWAANKAAAAACVDGTEVNESTAASSWAEEAVGGGAATTGRAAARDALSLLSTARIGGRVRAVIDRNPARIGRAARRGLARAHSAAAVGLA